MPLGSSLMGELGEGFKLPITRRGLFNKDDFFKGFQQEYSEAVGDVLDKWRSRSSLADRFASYKKLREKDHSDDSQAATVSDTPGNHVIVIDMSEYASGQITVETSGFFAVVDAQSGGGGAQTYNRRFPLPQDTIIDGVVADLSADNILTVTAPRKGRNVGINHQPNGSGTSVSSSTQQQSTRSMEEQVIPTVATSTERVIPMMREGAPTATHKTQQIIESSTRRGSTTRVIPLNVEGDTTEVTGSQTTSTTAQTSSTGERIIPTIKQTDAKSSMQYGNASSNNRVLSIKKRGRFFQDAAFENVWKDFETAIDDMVERKGAKGENGDDDKFKAYRNLRYVVQPDDSQAGTVIKENNAYKIVLDVKEFADGQLDVKAVTGSVLVTGQMGTRSFERRFSIPGLSQPEGVAASLSTDGILTVTAPL